MIAAALTLLRTGLFDDLPDATVASVAEQAEWIDVDEGQRIVTEGDLADAFFVILDGEVVMHTTARDGTRIELARQGPGTHFGEQALLQHNGIRTAHVSTVGPARLLRLSPEILSALVADAPTLRARLDSLGQRYLENRLARRSALVRTLVRHQVTHQEQRHAPGDVVVRASTPSAHTYVVVQGAIVLHEIRGEEWVRVRRLGPGLAFGQGETHRYTAIAEVESLLWRVPHSAVAGLHTDHPQLGEQLGAIRDTWALPQRGVVTEVVGELGGMPCIDQHYALDDGRTVVASHVPEAATLHVSTVGLAAPHSLETPDGHLTLQLDDEGRVRGLCARASKPQVGTAVGWILDAHRLSPTAQANLLRTGTIDVPATPLACTCLRVNGETAREHFRCGGTVDGLQRKTGAGTVCGTCLPGLRALAGEQVFLPVVVDEVTMPVENVARVVLRHRDGRTLPQSRPGQHVVLRVSAHGQTFERSYTLCNAPGTPWTLLIKMVPDGQMGRWLRTEARAGVALQATPPSGSCVWDGGPAPVLLFVAGIGVTPALAMARTLLANGWPHRMVIDWSVRAASDTAMCPDLTQSLVANLVLHLRVTRAKPRLQEADVRGWVERFPSAVAFICGPDAYQQAVKQWLIDASLPPTRIHVESFQVPG